ncbi:hypothetical protein EJP67_16675 [Variovorax guangxiensis]|uniref:Uncharacterized protein n=1 Tax=Variovorax guangxiensis TaxID=1775474 RepID=A0A3S0XFK9_9BURK|nr:hypothetical protein [Variovorax guangxiensis]RUR68698.1 hypothetical protein EJP67_16675 [Variovorax guangxiensis]
MNLAEAVDRLSNIDHATSIRGHIEAFELCAPHYSGSKADVVMVRSSLWFAQLPLPPRARAIVTVMAIEAQKALLKQTMSPVSPAVQPSQVAVAALPSKHKI